MRTAPFVKLFAACLCVLLAATGCGFIRDARDVAEGVRDLAKDSDQFETKFAKAKNLTFTATYELRSGSEPPKRIVHAQKPPKAAYLETDNQLIDDGTNLVTCSPGSDSQPHCTIIGPHTDAGIFGVSTFTFAFSSVAFLTLFKVLAISPEIDRTQDTQTIAGQKSDCEKLTKVRGEDQGDKIEICITENGVISRYDVGDGDVVELVDYKDTADDSAFVPAATPQALGASGPSGPATSPPAGTAAGSEFCTKVQGVKDLGTSVGLAPGSVPNAAALKQIRDAQAAITPPQEIAAAWAENLRYQDQTIALQTEAEAAGKTTFEEPYLGRAMTIAQQQSASSRAIDAYVQPTCGFSISYSAG